MLELQGPIFPPSWTRIGNGGSPLTVRSEDCINFIGTGQLKTDAGAEVELARIAVLDGHSAAALAIVRSAGRAGHWIAVGAERGSFAAAKLSRYCSYRFDYPASTANASAFLESVLAFVRLNSIDLVIPVTDWTLAPLSGNRDRFTGMCRLVLPPHAALIAASDKYQTVRLAESLGIDVPKTFLVDSEKDLQKLQQPSFPVVVKDRFSVRWNQDRAVSGSVKYAYTIEELRRIVSERVQATGDVLVQEFAAGVGVGVSFFSAEGKAFLPFEWQRVREVDPRGSGSCARKSLPLDPKLFSSSVNLVRELGFEGVAMVEYKRTPDGRAILMEINGRPWGSIGLPIACGIDYPRYLIDWYLRGTLPPEHIPYKQNVLCRRAVGELTHLAALRAGPPPNWPIPYPGFWKTLLAMAAPWRPGMCYDDLWVTDFRPGLAGIGNWFRSRAKPKREVPDERIRVVSLGRRGRKDRD